MRIKISKKEAKETRYWLKLLICNIDLEVDRNKLVQEVTELMKIFGAILEKTKNKEKS
jgi:four helix bundle protein